MGAPLQAGVGPGEAEVVFLSISFFQREIGDDRCVSIRPNFWTPRNAVGDTLLYLLRQLPTHTNTQADQASDSGQAQDSSSSRAIACKIMHCFEKKPRFNSGSGRNVLGAGLGLVGPLYCLANLKVRLLKL